MMIFSTDSSTIMGNYKKIYIIEQKRVEIFLELCIIKKGNYYLNGLYTKSVTLWKADK